MNRMKDVAGSFYRSITSAFVLDVDPPVVCVQCLRTARQYLCAKTKEGFDLTFCSDQCSYTYWEEYGRHGKLPPSAAAAGPRTCRFPGCNKPCFVEGSKVHDYCGRTHAREHGAMISPKTRGWAKGGGATTGYTRQNSGGSQGTAFFSGWGKKTGPILFYNRGEPCYEFTNFYEVVVRIDGKDWLTTEHYFQAQKFVGTPLVGTIRMLERPRDAFDKSRDPRYSHWRRSDWEQVKEDVMFKALQAKFTQHEYLRRMLVETKERKLVEHSPYDSYWGDGGDGSGKNRLGELLMILRGDLTPKPHPRAPSPPPQMHRHPPSPPVLVNDQLQRDAPTHTSPPPPLQQQSEWRTPHFSPDPDKDDGLAPQPTQCQTDLQQNTASQNVPVSNPLPAARTQVTLAYSSVVAGASHVGPSATIATPLNVTQPVVVQSFQQYPPQTIPYQPNPQSTIMNQQSTMLNQQVTMLNQQSIVPQSTVPNPQLIPQSTIPNPQLAPQSTIPNPQLTVPNPQLNPQSTMLTPQPTMLTPQSTIPNPQTTVQVPLAGQPPGVPIQPNFQHTPPLSNTLPSAAGAAQQLTSTTVSGGNLMGEFTNSLTRNSLPGYRAASANAANVHPAMLPNVQAQTVHLTTNPVPTPQDDSTPMDTTN